MKCPLKHPLHSLLTVLGFALAVAGVSRRILIQWGQHPHSTLPDKLLFAWMVLGFVIAAGLLVSLVVDRVETSAALAVAGGFFAGLSVLDGWMSNLTFTTTDRVAGGLLYTGLALAALAAHAKKVSA